MNPACMPETRVNTTIRTATPADESGLGELESSCFDEDRRSSPRSLKRSLSSPHQVVRVVDRAAVVGPSSAGLAAVAVYWLYPRSLRLYSVAVCRESRGAGLGRLLVADAFREARERGLSRVTLEADQTDATLVRWYESQGFVVTAQLPSYYAPGRPAVRMSCTVT